MAFDITLGNIAVSIASAFAIAVSGFCFSLCIFLGRFHHRSDVAGRNVYFPDGK